MTSRGHLAICEPYFVSTLKCGPVGSLVLWTKMRETAKPLTMNMAAILHTKELSDPKFLVVLQLRNSNLHNDNKQFYLLELFV